MIARETVPNDSGLSPARFVTIDDSSSLDAELLAALAPLEGFMRKVCILIDEHPEWRYQSAHERMDSFLEAVRQL